MWEIEGFHCGIRGAFVGQCMINTRKFLRGNTSSLLFFFFFYQLTFANDSWKPGSVHMQCFCIPPRVVLHRDLITFCYACKSGDGEYSDLLLPVKHLDFWVWYWIRHYFLLFCALIAHTPFLTCQYCRNWVILCSLQCCTHKSRQGKMNLRTGKLRLSG